MRRGQTDHTIESEHRPHIDILQNHKAIARLEFPVRLEIRVEGAVLKIEKGRVQEIASGKLMPKIVLKLDEFVLLEKEFPSLQITGSIRIAPQLNDGGRC
jgi:hypothetical protein